MIQIESIKEKLKLLRKLDSRFSIFGASSHKYELTRPLNLDKIERFETNNGINLPLEYVQFLTKIGNGGAGPFYGLEPLENCLFQDLDYKRADSVLNPSKPFVHTAAWNMKFEATVDHDENEKEYESQLEAFEEKYFDPQHINGAIAICNFGCAIRINLIVNGEEYGNIWTDDRASDNGIYPSRELGNEDRITFLNWYEKWLDNSLSQVEKAK